MDQTTLLYRQVNPDWIKEGRPTSQTFSPFPKDKGKLSVYNGDKWTAEDSFDHFTETQGFDAEGNVAVAVSECTTSQLDAVEDNKPYDGHAYIDYTPYSSGQIKTKAKQLKKAALDRGWTYLKKA